MNVVKHATVNLWMIYCPACECCHGINETWIFNGDLEKPTISPSILAKTGDIVCHSFVENGIIRFLGDCTHKMANQTVALQPAPWWKNETS